MTVGAFFDNPCSPEEAFDLLCRKQAGYAPQQIAGWTPIFLSVNDREVVDWLEANVGPRYNPTPEKDQEIRGKPWGTWNLPARFAKGSLYIIKDRRVALTLKLIYG